MGARKGGTRVASHPLPPGKSPPNLFAILGTFLLLFLHMGALSLRFSHYGGPFFTMWGPFRYIFGRLYCPVLLQIAVNDIKAVQEEGGGLLT